MNRNYFVLRQEELILPSVAIEAVYRRCLPQYVEFAQRHLGLSYPFRVVAGVTGLENALLAIPASYGNGERVRFLVQNLEVSRRLLDERDQVPFLVEWFQQIWDGCGMKRPAQIAEFPTLNG